MRYKLLFVSFITFLFFTGISCTKNKQSDEEDFNEQTENDNNNDDNNPPDTSDTITMTKYLALGDSYTIGEGVAESQRYPNQLLEKLNEDITVLRDVQIIAQTGWTTTNLLSAIESTEMVDEYAMVSLLIGVNNQYQGLSIENYRTEFVELLNMSVGFAGNDPTKVIVLSIPDWGVTPFANGRDRDQIAQEIDAFNAVNFEEAQKTGVHYVDVTPISREAANNPNLLAPDGLHPSGIMYEYWADFMLPIAENILSENKKVDNDL